jgi:hypothetical protein
MPLVRPRGVASTRIMATIGSGLTATPAASPRTSPIAAPMALLSSTRSRTMAAEEMVCRHPRRVNHPLRVKSAHPGWPTM